MNALVFYGVPSFGFMKFFFTVKRLSYALTLLNVENEEILEIVFCLASSIFYAYDLHYFHFFRIR